jgi:hypothetical protein
MFRKEGGLFLAARFQKIVRPKTRERNAALTETNNEREKGSTNYNPLTAPI